MSEALAVIWFAAAIGGALAGVVGVVAHGSRRRTSLMVAGAGFGLAGVLGILSIGIILLAMSAACFVIASRTPAGPAPTASQP